MSTPTTPQPQMMMCPPMPWMPNYPQMMGAQPQMPDQDPGFRKGMEKNVTTAGIPLKKLPMVRLGESIEFL